jgi:hypothetical protein
MLSWQASCQDKVRENRFGAARNQLYRHDGEDEPWDLRAYRHCCQQSKTEHDYAERIPVQGRFQPPNSDVLRGCLTYDFLQQP